MHQIAYGIPKIFPGVIPPTPVPDWESAKVATLGKGNAICSEIKKFKFMHRRQQCILFLFFFAFKIKYIIKKLNLNQSQKVKFAYKIKFLDYFGYGKV